MLYVLQKYSHLPDVLLQELLALCQKKIDEPFRINVMLILQKQRRDLLDKLPPANELCNKSYVQLLIEQTGGIKTGKCQKLLRQMADSGEIEKKIFAAYIQLKYSENTP